MCVCVCLLFLPSLARFVKQRAGHHRLAVGNLPKGSTIWHSLSVAVGYFGDVMLLPCCIVKIHYAGVD